MSDLTIGGDPERYMDPPILSGGGGDSGAPSFIASLLDLLGIHRQVAKPPKQKDLAKDSKPLTQDKNPAKGSKPKKGEFVPKPDVLDTVEASVTRLPMTSSNFVPFGAQRSADRNNPLTPIDPDLGILGLR